jgi:hypothetical protein
MAPMLMMAFSGWAMPKKYSIAKKLVSMLIIKITLNVVDMIHLDF